MDYPGTRTLEHYKPHNRGTWNPHRHKGWYVSPEMIYCRCLTSYIPKTAKERVSNTTDFFPSNPNIARNFIKVCGNTCG